MAPLFNVTPDLEGGKGKGKHTKRYEQGVEDGEINEPRHGALGKRR